MQGKSNSKKYFMKIFGKIIEQHRLISDKSMYLVSAESAIAKSSWREIELGKRSDLNLSTFCKIAEGLDIPADVLLKELLDKLGKDFSFTDLNS